MAPAEKNTLDEQPFGSVSGCCCRWRLLWSVTACRAGSLPTGTRRWPISLATGAAGHRAFGLHDQRQPRLL